MKITAETTSSDNSSVVTPKGHDDAMDNNVDVLKLVDLYYIVNDNDDPIIYVISRSEDGNQRVIKVTDFSPYFCVSFDDLTLDDISTLEENWRVVEVVEDDVDGDAMKVVCRTPYDIPKLRDEFTSLEADVQYVDRFLIDSGIRQYFTAPPTKKVHWSQLQSIEATDAPSITPRICYLDIEVKMDEDGDGPSVVSEEGTELAMQPITAVTAYDNYDDAYYIYVLESSSWTAEQRQNVVNTIDELADDGGVYEDERTMMQNFNQHVIEKQYDILVGWNSNSFDIPYIVNRCLKELDEYTIFQWSPTKDVSTMHGEGRFLNSDLKGILLFDLLKGFEKTQIHELKSYALSNVADEVLDDLEKMDVGDLDDAWQSHPVAFTEYSHRDVEAMVEIDKEVGVLGY